MTNEVRQPLSTVTNSLNFPQTPSNSSHKRKSVESNPVCETPTQTLEFESNVDVIEEIIKSPADTQQSKKSRNNGETSELSQKLEAWKAERAASTPFAKPKNSASSAVASSNKTSRPRQSLGSRQSLSANEIAVSNSTSTPRISTSRSRKSLSTNETPVGKSSSNGSFKTPSSAQPTKRNSNSGGKSGAASSASSSTTTATKDYGTNESMDVKVQKKILLKTKIEIQKKEEEVKDLLRKLKTRESEFEKRKKILEEEKATFADRINNLDSESLDLVNQQSAVEQLRATLEGEWEKVRQAQIDVANLKKSQQDGLKQVEENMACSKKEIEKVRNKQTTAATTTIKHAATN